MLRYRLLLGPVLLAVVFALAWLDQWIDGIPATGFWRTLFRGRETPPPGIVMFFSCVAVSIVAARELVDILKDKGINASKRITTAAAVAGLLTSALVPSEADGTTALALVSTVAVLVLLVSLAFSTRHKSTQGVVAAAGGTLLAFVYLGLMFGFLLAIRREHSVWVVLWVLVVAKSCDIGAYFTGKSIGRHKLILWLSPGKTWEGLAGGMAVAALVGVAGLWVLRQTGERVPELWTGAVAGLIFAVVGQTGDLIASLFKRDAGIKDSGKVLPGFGGVLDVLDSPLLVAPVAFWWLRAIHA